MVRHRADDEVRPYLLKQLSDVGEARHAARVRHGGDPAGADVAHAGELGEVALGLVGQVVAVA